MRFLTIVRHAKSSPAGTGQRDYDRELSGRGRRQCDELRTWASDPERGARFGPAIALVSAAARTRETYARAFDETPLVEVAHFSELIYNGRRDVTAEDLLIELAALDPVTSSLLVVAHNPTVHELLWTLLGTLPASARDGYPLAGAYVLALKDNEQIGLARYWLIDEFTPKGSKAPK